MTGEQPCESKENKYRVSRQEPPEDIAFQLTARMPVRMAGTAGGGAGRIGPAARFARSRRVSAYSSEVQQPGRTVPGDGGPPWTHEGG